MIRLGSRSKAPRMSAGPRVGAVVTPEGVTVRVLNEGERTPLPRSVVLADDATADSIARAAQAVVARLEAHKRLPVVITVLA